MTAPLPAELSTLSGHLDGHLAYVLAAARGERPWREALQYYGLGHQPGTTPPHPDVVQLVIAEVAKRAREGLEAQVASGAVGAEYRGLFLETLGKHAFAADSDYRSTYEAPAPKHGVAAIFQNAIETGKLLPWAGVEYEQQLTLKCKSCGAPQREIQNFKCIYCAGDVFRRKTYEGS